jgi:hypothetical protein
MNSFESRGSATATIEISAEGRRHNSEASG